MVDDNVSGCNGRPSCYIACESLMIIPLRYPLVKMSHDFPLYHDVADDHY
jgi:hypothetical protein